MKKIKVGEAEVEFYEEKDILPIFDELFQAAGRRGVSEKVINKTQKKILKLTKKAQKMIDKGKPDASKLRDLRNSINRIKDITKNPSSYTGGVIEEILKSM